MPKVMLYPESPSQDAGVTDGQQSGERAGRVGSCRRGQTPGEKPAKGLQHPARSWQSVLALQSVGDLVGRDDGTI